ncbi:MAG: peptide-methionine (S)-S-oxide reductase MsrA [bacterium]
MNRFLARAPIVAVAIALLGSAYLAPLSVAASLPIAAPAAARADDPSGARSEAVAYAASATKADGAPVARAGKSAKPAPAARAATAVFAMGCFWCGETQFEEQPGVLTVVSGYTGGPERNPTYDQVSAGATGHYEAIEIRYDPVRTDYATLLDLFWRSVDPTQANGQFCDHGPQYRSAVFVADSTQRRIAEQSKRALERSGVLKAPIVTAILPAATFWPAEDYHQDFWRKDPVRYRSYREGCGRDRRLRQLWGERAAKPLVH